MPAWLHKVPRLTCRLLLLPLISLQKLNPSGKKPPFNEIVFKEGKIRSLIALDIFIH